MQPAGGSVNPKAVITPGQSQSGQGSCSQQCPPFSTLDTGGSCQCVPCAVSTCPFGQTLDPLTCQCKCPVTYTCANPQVFDDVLCTCRCPSIMLCNKGLAFYNLDTCKCECPLQQTGCGPNQVLDVLGCTCHNPPTAPPRPAPIFPQCQYTVCGVGQIFNPITCACECSPAAASSCNSLQQLDPNTCQCKCVRVMALVTTSVAQAVQYPQPQVQSAPSVSVSSVSAGTKGPRGHAGTKGPGGRKGPHKGRRNIDSLLRVVRGPKTKAATKPRAHAAAPRPSISISSSYVQSPQVIQPAAQYTQSQSIQMLPYCPAGQIADAYCNCH